MATFEQTLRTILILHEKAEQTERDRLDLLKSDLAQDKKDELDRDAQKSIAKLGAYKLDALAELLRYPPCHVGVLSKLEDFRKDGSFEKSIFIMTKFPGAGKAADKELAQVIRIVEKAVTEAGYIPRIASKKNYHEMLWENVALHLLGCSKGIAIVESKHTEELNPNVAMEWGWMRSMGKRVLFLAEKSFNLRRADWSGLIEDEFQWENPKVGIRAAVKKFLT